MVKVLSDMPFLVCGLPKSGTTFLQRTLDLHPQISCPSEQSFLNLGRILQQALQNYAQILETYDRRTGGQGASRYGATIENDMLRSTIVALSKSFARGRPIHGLNDNGVFIEIERYINLLGSPKIVGIIRNPVDVGLSVWRHSRRLAREEPGLAHKHLAIIENPKQTVEGMIELMLPSYRASVERFLELAATRPNLHVVSYEQLVATKEPELKRLLRFLGADSDDGVLARMIDLSSREAMAASSRNPEFFGLKGDDPDRVGVSRDFRRAALEAAMSPRMQAIGYDVSALMVGH
jgi:hypothetical protein